MDSRTASILSQREIGDADMLTAADALRAHNQCKALTLQCLKQPPYCMDFFDFKPHEGCELMQFLQECESRHHWLEINILRAAHQTFHNRLLELAQKRLAGEEFDIEEETSSDSQLQRASAALVAAIWRLERRLHSMAG